MAERSPDVSTTRGPSNVEAPELLLPPRGSIERTGALIRSHHEISRHDLRGREGTVQTPHRVGHIIEKVHADFKQLLWEFSSPPIFVPARIFLHSDVLVPGDEASTHYLNFLAEVRNPAGDFIVLSEHGWSLHRAGPAFSHLHASVSSPPQFFSHKLYSLDAFCEEMEQIREHGLASLLGLQPRSFILETALDSIQRFRSHTRPEANAFSRIEVLSHVDSSARLLLVAPSLGAFEVRVRLTPQLWFIECSAQGAAL